MKMEKFLFKPALVLIIITILFGSLNVGAKTVFSSDSQVPYESYTYWDDEANSKAVYTKPLFDSADVYDSYRLGIEDFESLADVTVAQDGFLYLIDSKQSRVVILNNNYEFVSEFYEVGGNTFIGAQGIFAYGELIYIADTENARVIVSDREGVLKQIITLPEFHLIPEDFKFRPIKVSVDSDGYMYVLSDGSYYGAILYSPKGEFLSFYGANAVNAGLTQALLNLWNKLTMTNEKRKGQASKIPYQFTDLYVDKDNFIYTATGKTKDNELQTGVLRMLSPNSINVLPSDGVVFGEKDIASSGNPDFVISTQNIAGLAVDEYGFIYTYDTSFGRIYLYDSQCNMFCAFGSGLGVGVQKGTFQQIAAIDIMQDDVLVIDGLKNSLSVFRCNDYGKQVKKLQRMTLDGDYSGTRNGWEKVNSVDKNNRFAYIGLAKAAYAEGDYETAMSYAKTANNKDTYSQAFRQVRTVWLRKNFIWIFASLILLASAFVLIGRYKKKHSGVIKNIKTHLFMQSIFHPAATFTEIKQKKLGSIQWAIVSLIVFYLSVATQEMFGGFVFVSGSTGNFNSILLFIRTVGLVLLWTITNWGVCTLMGGIGKMKEIFVVVCYSLVPMIIGNVLYTAITHMLIQSEAAFMVVIMTALQLYSIIMIIIGTIVIHDFSFGKFVGTTILTILGMAIVLLVGVLVIILIQQFTAFLSTVFNELVYK